MKECRDVPAKAEAWGVERPNTILVGDEETMVPPCHTMWGETPLILYRHPSLLVSRSVKLWQKEYIYSGDNYSAMPWLDRHPCALEAKEVYDDAFAFFKSTK